MLLRIALENSFRKFRTLCFGKSRKYYYSCLYGRIFLVVSDHSALWRLLNFNLRKINKLDGSRNFINMTLRFAIEIRGNTDTVTTTNVNFLKDRKKMMKL